MFQGESWLEVTVDGRLLGRQRVLSAPHAIGADAPEIVERLFDLQDLLAWRVEAEVRAPDGEAGARLDLDGRPSMSPVPIPPREMRLLDLGSSASSEVRIACERGIAPFGADCGAADEAMGVSFVPPASADVVYACLRFHWCGGLAVTVPEPPMAGDRSSRW